MSQFARVLSPWERLTGQEHLAYSAVAPRSSKKPDREGAKQTNKAGSLIKCISQYKFTISNDFFELAQLVQNMVGVSELLFGFDAHLTVMLDNWHQFPTQSVGKMIPTLLQLATDACAVLGALRTRATQRQPQHNTPGFRAHTSAARG